MKEWFDQNEEMITLVFSFLIVVVLSLFMFMHLKSSFNFIKYEDFLKELDAKNIDEVYFLNDPEVNFFKIRKKSDKKDYLVENSQKIKKKELEDLLNKNNVKIEYSKIKSKSSEDILSYNEFLLKVESEDIRRVVLTEDDSDIIAFDMDGVKYKVSNPKTDNFKEFLLLNNIDVEEKEAISSFTKVLIVMLQTFLPLALIFWLLNKSMPKTNMDKLSSSYSKVKFKNVEGIDEVKKDIEIIVDFLKDPEEYKNKGARMPKGVILYGPPGTGKTLTAKAIAGEAGVPFYSVSGSDFVEMYVGLGAKRVRALYKEAKKNAPCIVFIDEIDAVGKSRGSTNNSEMDQTLNALLTEIDGFDGSEGIITMVATNRIEDLDSALIRPGRFDKHLAIPLPDKTARYNILKVHSKNKDLSEDVSLEELSSITAGFSGAGLESLLNEAVIISISNNHDKIEKSDIDDAFYKVLMKGNKKENQHLRPRKELEIVAWHEAGHALLTKLLTNDEVNKVTILASTSGAGGVTFRTPDDNALPSKKDLENMIAVMYGGRIAEHLLLGDKNKVTIGASNDIEKATELIKNYIVKYGMSEDLRMINVDILLGNNVGTQDILLREAINMSESIYRDAYNLLLEHKDTLEQIAEELLEKETLDNEDLNRIINK